MPVLARAWQMLLKGLEEVQTAPAPAQAAEMVLVRLAYVADLPVPGRSGARARGEAADAPRVSHRRRAAGVRGQRPPGPPASRAPRSPQCHGPPTACGRRRARSAIETRDAAAAAPESPPQPATVCRCVAGAELDPPPQSFAEVVELFDKRREALLRLHLLVARASRRVRAGPDRVPAGRRRAARPANRLVQLLGEWTGTRWVVAVSQAEGAPTLAEQEAQRDERAAERGRGATRWCGRCWTPFPARRSRRCATVRRRHGDVGTGGERCG